MTSRPGALVNMIRMLLAVSILFFIMGTAQAEEGRIVTIASAENETSPTAIKIDAPELTVEENVIVIWLNSLKNHEVNILFQKNDLPENAVTDATGFNRDKNGLFSAKYLPFIATASMRFVKAGTYPYTVELVKGGAPVTGTIVVTTPQAPCPCP